MVRRQSWIAKPIAQAISLEKFAITDQYTKLFQREQFGMYFLLIL